MMSSYSRPPPLSLSADQKTFWPGGNGGPEGKEAWNASLSGISFSRVDINAILIAYAFYAIN
jgi:hypothetical protein